MMTTAIDYRMINRNFVIRWREHNDPSTKGNLIGAGRFAEKFGEKYADKFFEKAFFGGEHRYEFRIRGKYIIVFNSK